MAGPSRRGGRHTIVKPAAPPARVAQQQGMVVPPTEPGPRQGGYQAEAPGRKAATGCGGGRVCSRAGVKCAGSGRLLARLCPKSKDRPCCCPVRPTRVGKTVVWYVQSCCWLRMSTPSQGPGQVCLHVQVVLRNERPSRAGSGLRAKAGRWHL